MPEARSLLVGFWRNLVSPAKSRCIVRWNTTNRWCSNGSNRNTPKSGLLRSGKKLTFSSAMRPTLGSPCRPDLGQKGRDPGCFEYRGTLQHESHLSDYLARPYEVHDQGKRWSQF